MSQKTQIRTDSLSQSLRPSQHLFLKSVQLTLRKMSFSLSYMRALTEPLCVCVLAIIVCLSAIHSVSASPIYVKQDATGLNSGSSWEHAYTNLQTALSAVEPDGEVWVASGVYVPGTSRTSSFKMKVGMVLYGGFFGTEVSLADRVWSSNATILSGDVLGDDAGLVNLSDNVYQVVTGAEGSTLDGFTVTGGNADSGLTAYTQGAGMNNSSVSTHIRNCIFANNSANGDGGAISCRGDSSFSVITSRIENCRFISNRSGRNGGALALSNSSNIIDSCSFLNNYSDNDGGSVAALRCHNLIQGSSFVSNSTYFGRQGGAVISSYSRSTFTDCVVAGNFGPAEGGGVYISGGNDIEPSTLRDCLFVNNDALRNGGGVCTWNAEISAERCVFAGNRLEAGSSVGGAGMNIKLSTQGLVSVRECIFTDNGWGAFGGGLALPYDSGTASVTTEVMRCIFSGNAGKHGGGLYVQNTYAPLVENCVFAGNMASDNGGGGYFNSASPRLWNSTVVGNSAVSKGGGFEFSSAPQIGIINSILWSNAAPGGAEISARYSSASFVAFCDINGGWNGPYVKLSGGSVTIDGGSNREARPFSSVFATGVWMGYPVYDAETCQSLLRDDNGQWSVNAMKGMYVQPDPSSVRLYYIAGNDSNTISIFGDYSSHSFTGLSYTVHDYRLSVDSVCVDSGTNLTSMLTDLEEFPRPLDGDDDGVIRYDIGAYEFLNEEADSDGDGFADGAEVVADTDLLDDGSRLCITSVTPQDNSILIRWTGGVLATQYVERSVGLATGSMWTTVFTNCPPTTSDVGFVDAGDLHGMHFYRLRVGQ